jgi:hypothetical protein
MVVCRACLEPMCHEPSIRDATLPRLRVPERLCADYLLPRNVLPPPIRLVKPTAVTRSHAGHFFPRVGVH